MKRPQHHGAVPERNLSNRISARKSLNPRARVQRAEQAEVRRFTEGARRQRRTRLTVTLTVVTFLTFVSVLVLSPLMSLQKIVVSGNDYVKDKVIIGAVKDQLGTPLALVNYDSITSRLSSVIEVQSFSTEIRPPHTLVIRVVERTPIGALKSAKGWDIVDAAGVVIRSTKSKPKGVPELQIAGVDAEGFAPIVKTLLALPPALRSDVAAVGASTRDTVTFVLRGVEHEIRWGSDENSALKAVVLDRALAIAKKKGGTFIIDVSAPDTLIMNRAN
ncbi:MAG: hypothetical protein RLZ72_832 [Actinomycetota bacterium]